MTGSPRCHRGDPVTFDAGRRGVIILTRVRALDGSQHVEIRSRITLARGDQPARAHLARIMLALHALLRHVTRLPR